jgi:hypothetical protein
MDHDEDGHNEYKAYHQPHISSNNNIIDTGPSTTTIINAAQNNSNDNDNFPRPSPRPPLLQHLSWQQQQQIKSLQPSHLNHQQQQILSYQPQQQTRQQQQRQQQNREQHLLHPSLEIAVDAAVQIGHMLTISSCQSDVDKLLKELRLIP